MSTLFHTFLGIGHETTHKLVNCVNLPGIIQTWRHFPDALSSDSLSQTARLNGICIVTLYITITFYVSLQLQTLNKMVFLHVPRVLTNKGENFITETVCISIPC
jgi:hypothetical protein